MEQASKPEKMKALTFAVRPAGWAACKAAGIVWSGVYLSPIGGLRLQTADVPKLPAEDWVLCRTRLGGICGTDLNMVYLQNHPASMAQKFVSWPIFMGHENVAEIAAVGSAVSNLAPGQRVLVDPSLSCATRKINPPCRSCRDGKPSLCLNFDRGSLPVGLGLGYNNFTGGSWSPWFVAHTSQTHPLPDSIPDEQAILIDPISCSLHAVLQNLPQTGEKILVYGAGIIGLGTILMLRALKLPVEITATVRYDHQAELARRMGADHVVFWGRTQPNERMDQLAKLTGAKTMICRKILRFLQGGFDRVYDCTGKAAGLIESQRLIHPGGTLVIAGTPQLGFMDVTSFWFRELKIFGVTGRNCEPLPGQPQARHDYDHVIDLIGESKLDFSSLTVRLYRQDQYRQAIGNARFQGRTGFIKSAFDFR